SPRAASAARRRARPAPAARSGREPAAEHRLLRRSRRGPAGHRAGRLGGARRGRDAAHTFCSWNSHEARVIVRLVRLLVVEDDVKMAALVRRGLSEEGAAVDIARSGEDALWMAAATAYDAVVLDVVLPGIDGFETCRRLRDDGVWTPVLLLTALDSVEDPVAGLDGGPDDYLTN